MVAWANHVGVSEIARPCRPGQVHGVAQDPPQRMVQPGGGPDVVLQDGHRPRQEPAQGAAVPPPALVGRSPALGAGGPVDTGPAPAPPGADRGPHHDPGAPTWAGATQPSFRAVHSGLGDHALGGHTRMSARPRPQEAPQEGPSRRAGQDRSPTSWASGPRPPTPPPPSPWTGATSSPPGPALQEPLGAPVHFCEARCPWQRGTNENTNGLLREYFPKRTPLGGTSPTRTQQVHNQLNQRPRKRLGCKPPRKPTHRTLHFL